MKILIPGASGLLGINLALEATKTFDTVGTYLSNKLHNTPFKTIACDLSQTEEINDLVSSVEPDLIINCAALANVDACESQIDQARSLNTALPAQLADITKMKNIKFIHISTDAVFDGQNKFYLETDEPNPLNQYAQSKLDGECEVTQRNPDAIIARTNIFGWSLKGKRSLAEWFFNNLSAGNQIKGFTDVTFCPLFVGDLAKILIHMAQQDLKGLYHVVGGDCPTKFEFGKAIAHKFGFDEKLITPTSWKDGSLAATRSSNLCLNIDKLTKAMRIPPPRLEQGLEEFFKQYSDGYPDQLRDYLAVV